jgi:hypothetical protein
MLAIDAARTAAADRRRDLVSEDGATAHDGGRAAKAAAVIGVAAE